MSKEVELERLQELMRKEYCRSFSTIEEIRKEFGVVWSEVELEVAGICDDPAWLVLIVKLQDRGNRRDTMESTPLCAVFPKEDLESFARSVLQVDPPVEQQILQELRALRKAVESSRQQS